MSVSDACLASGVPLTTALRWVGTLAKEGWISRNSDPFDGRRVFVSLTQQGLSAMRAYLSEVRLEATD
jgi:DNA-binding MarR family transcriptional regulator